jgi:hypothetical protein
LYDASGQKLVVIGRTEAYVPEDQVIDRDELLLRICGAARVAAFKDVKITSMRLATVARDVIADDLHGELPTHGKQFLKTRQGLWRLASGPNSDNTTEQAMHRRAGARYVLIFGDISPAQESRDWISLAELYRLHRVKFDSERFLQAVANRVPRP